MGRPVLASQTWATPSQPAVATRRLSIVLSFPLLLRAFLAGIFRARLAVNDPAEPVELELAAI